jgi:hypothetical protein
MTCDRVTAAFGELRAEKGHFEFYGEWFDDQFLSDGVFQALNAVGRALPAAVPTVARVAGRGLAGRIWGTPYQQYFAQAERIFVAYEGRPRWQAPHPRRRHLAARHPRFDEFTALCDRLDPGRRFANPYLRRVWGE